MSIGEESRSLLMSLVGMAGDKIAYSCTVMDTFDQAAGLAQPPSSSHPQPQQYQGQRPSIGRKFNNEYGTLKGRGHGNT